jgi:hypothetical protein
VVLYSKNKTVNKPGKIVPKTKNCVSRRMGKGPDAWEVEAWEVEAWEVEAWEVEAWEVEAWEVEAWEVDRYAIQTPWKVRLTINSI